MIFLGLALFALLVIVHELGHFIAARHYGVRVEEFGLGFPPKLFGRRLGKGFWRAYYSFNLLPLGGFVRLKGENEADKRPGSYGAASFRAKAAITLAGVAVNYLVAISLISTVAAIRLPVLFDSQFTVASDTTELRRDVVVALVTKGSPAEAVGITPGDVIRKLNGTDLTDPGQLSDLTKANAGEEITLSLQRSSQNLEVRPHLAEAPADGRSFLGIGPQEIIERRVGWSAPVVGFVVTNQFAWETLKLLGSAVGDLLGGHAGQAAANLTGPVGVVAIFRAVQSLPQLLLITGAISLSLAIMNILPIPALDGGRLALSGLFKLFRKTLTPKIENTVHTTGFVILVGLLILISVVDAKRFF